MTRPTAILLCLLHASIACAQSVVHLRHLAVVDGDAPVTLAMVADLAGDEAAALADVVIIDRPAEELARGTRSGTVDIPRIRQTLRDVKGVDFSRLLLKGSSCTVRPISMPAPRHHDTPAHAAVLPVLASSVPTTIIKGHVALAIARSLDVDPGDVRLTFDPRDARILATTALGRTVDAAPTGRSDDMPVRVTVYERERILLSETVRVGVEVRRPVCVMTATHGRDLVIGEDDFVVETRWLKPTTEPVSPEEAVGMAPKSRIKAGDPLMRDSATMPLIVEKGELVAVHCVSGSVVMQVPARAMADGRDGEVIEFKHLRGAGSFLARMSGRGRAVAVPADEPHEEPHP